ncbi:hypothetical protein [Cycloclasticus pugetii]|uniref:hypothetical protein n=1 Tax=Cycloclasticus pugetii TaxID=34068 RepID=UPI003A93B313
MKKGKQCPSCGKVNVQGAVQCRDCGADIKDARVALYNDYQFNKSRDTMETERTVADMQRQEESESQTISSTKYGMARSIAGGAEFVGWLVVIAGAITTMMSFGNANRFFSLMTLLPSLGTLVSGLFMIMGAQVTKATVDNADHTRELLNIAREHVAQKGASQEVKED